MHKKLNCLAACLALSSVFSPACAAREEATNKPVTAFRIIGSKVFSEAELLKLVNHAIGRPLDAAERDQLAGRITAHYRKHGYPRAYATLPEQNFNSGVIRFIIKKSGGVTVPPPAPKPEAVHIAAPDLLAASDAMPPPLHPENPVSTLARHAAWWMDRQRVDLARESLDKLFNIIPDYPDGLALRAQLEVKENKLQAAQTTLNTLTRIEPAHPALARLKSLIRIYGRDKDKLHHARQLAQQSRLPGYAYQAELALAEFRAIYTDGPPDDALAIEYWQLLANSKNGWKPAQEGLSRLVNDHPDNQRYRLALLEHEVYRTPGHAPVNLQNLKAIIAIFKIPEYRKQAQSVWRAALLRRPELPQDLPLLQEYLRFDPDDFAIREREHSIFMARAAHQKLLADPDYQAKIAGAALLAQGDLTAAEPLLSQALQARPNDADLIGEMGLLRMRQGQHAVAQAHFMHALRLSRGAGEKWKSLIRTSKFWQQMALTGEARQSGLLPVAKSHVDSALKIDPDEPHALALQADLHADLGESSKAEALYRHAIALNPVNGSALEGLLSLYLKQGRDADIGSTIAALTPAQTAAARLNRIQSEMLQRQADSLFAQGLDDAGIARLEQAAQINADDPWLQLALAKHDARRNAPEKGKILLTEFLASHPHDPDASYVLALYQSSLDERDQALLTLAQIPSSQQSDKTTLLQQRLRTERLIQQAQSRSAQDAAGALAEAETLSAGNEELTLAVALAWAEAGNRSRARALFERTRSDTLAWHLNYAAYLELTGEDERLREELKLISARGTLSAADTLQLNKLCAALAIRTSDALPDHPERAHQILAPELLAQPDHTGLLLADARAYRRESKWALAQAQYVKILQKDKTNPHALDGMIDTWRAAGNRGAALQYLDELTDTDLPSGLHRTGRLLELEEYERAEARLTPWLTAYPNHPRVLGYAAQIAGKTGRADAEIDYLQRMLTVEHAALTIAPSPEPVGIGEFGSPKKINRNGQEKKLAALIDRRSALLSSAIDISNRPGTAGMSQYHSVEIPLEYKTPWHDNDEVFVRVDAISLESGRVDPANLRFGSQLLCQPCATGLVLQAAQGLSLNAGYTRDTLRADIGVTPPGFPVSNFVGGISQSLEFGKLSYSLEASRRPVNSSVLSYAGTRDIRTGQIWGGVVATGMKLGISLDDGQALGLWSSLGVYSLTGQNVQSNQRLQLMAGGQWRIINEENRLFSVGLTGMYWHHTRNAGEYTFGHGGYYSPQNYRSLSLPVTYGERYPQFSWVMRGAVSMSQSQTQSALYFPTDSAQQAQAAALTPTTLITPVYASGNSRGTGYSLKGTGEYQLDPQVFLGGLLSIDRSDRYAPNRALFYLRYSPEHAGAQPVFLPPLPVEPSSKF